MKSVKLISLALAMLFCLVCFAQEKNIKIGIKPIKTANDSSTIMLIQPSNFEGSHILIESGVGPPGSIRCMSSLKNDNDPLYIIDGIPLTKAFYNNLKTDDINSIRVLRDHDSITQYGSRGRNGVIIISTKRKDNSEKMKKEVK